MNWNSRDSCSYQRRNRKSDRLHLHPLRTPNHRNFDKQFPEEQKSGNKSYKSFLRSRILRSSRRDLNLSRRAYKLSCRVIGRYFDTRPRKKFRQNKGNSDYKLNMLIRHLNTRRNSTVTCSCRKVRTLERCSIFRSDKDSHIPCLPELAEKNMKCNLCLSVRRK